ncbi:hypothetical protein [Leptothrix ochracea]|uniref:hypothetical protein n=1 Tax=Leptothrix ochracea TaxID=735331 RepID=UPI0034E1E9C1
MRTIFSAFLLSCLLAACADKGGYIVEATPEQNTSNVSETSNPVLPLEVDQQVAETFVKIAYGLNKGQRFQSTKFLTPILRTWQAAQLIKLVKRYNDFDGERVAAAVSSLKGRVSWVEFGREGSPVLYIELPYWTHQREETDPTMKGTKIDDTQNNELVKEIKHLFVDQLKADEFSVNHRSIRIWWD